MIETVKIDKWDVPKELFDKYVKFQILADGYLLGTNDVPSQLHQDYERMMRWKICVEQVMIIHRQICNELGIPYSTSDTDQFYSVFHKAVYEQTKLKG